MVDEYSSGAHGKAAVDRRVAEANARIAATLCECAMCERAAEGIRGRSRLAQEECSSSAAVHVVGRQAAEMGCSGEEATHGLQQSAAEAQLLTRRQKESKRKKANKRKKKALAALGVRQMHKEADAAADVEEGMEDEADAAAGVDAGHTGSEIVLKIIGNTNTVLEPTAAEAVGANSGRGSPVSQIQAYGEQEISFFECCEWPADEGEAVHTAEVTTTKELAAKEEETAASTTEEQEAEEKDITTPNLEKLGNEDNVMVKMP